MRLGTVLGLILVAPAAIAAATLGVFLGAGLLIAIAGPAPHHVRPRARGIRPAIARSAPAVARHHAAP